MGIEAKFQAIPERWKYFKKARKDVWIAQLLPFFRDLLSKDPHDTQDEEYSKLIESAQALAQRKPTLKDRYFYAGSRTFDIIIYLLSPHRRNFGQGDDNTDIIYKAFYGYELLHSHTDDIGLVPSEHVPTIATYLSTITRDALQEHFIPKNMTGVYKLHPHDGRFEDVWREFVGMRNVYVAAADNNEAVVVSIT